MKKRICAALMAATVGLGCLLGQPQSEAASRAEIARINVVRASDFKYWNEDSPTKEKIIRFVEEATNPDSKNFIPPAYRIATFDMDGTFYCETAPLYFQEVMFLHRVLDDSSYDPPKDLLNLARKIKPKVYNKEKLTPEESEMYFKGLTKAYEGMTPEEYSK